MWRKIDSEDICGKSWKCENANTPEADPTYFRGCKEFEVNGHKYLVGTSYGFKAKIAEIKGMFKICGADLSEFVLNGEPLKSNGSTGKSSGKNLWIMMLYLNMSYGNHTYSKQNGGYAEWCVWVDSQKYPGKIKNIAESDKITAVARKADLEQKTANASKVKQFKNYKGKNILWMGKFIL